MTKIKKRHNPILRAIDKLKINEGLEVKKEEHGGKVSFGNYVTASFCKRLSDKKIITRRLKDKSGWCVLRVK